MHPDDFVSKSCTGEKCSICGIQATKKIEEVLLDGKPFPRHPMNNYVCGDHFMLIMMPGIWEQYHPNGEFIKAKKI